MGQVSKAINGRTYRMNCNDGEERRLEELLSYVETHVSLLTEQFGQVGEARLMLMASLMIADELWDLRDDLEENARRAQIELRELAGLDLRPGHQDPSPDDVQNNGNNSKTGQDGYDWPDDDDDSPSSDMDIGIDQTPPSAKKRAYR